MTIHTKCIFCLDFYGFSLLHVLIIYFMMTRKKESFLISQKTQ